ncbi:Nitrite extrusion protein [Mycetohabitans rhizoxinica HKI 454]|uniref:Nitrite extrusion protein n=1 Tax=Mycetohabitans rhizoxinica (strain DSM 19002 / CIP 109453 / HKI 454) TaxID=882378 RepID=E5ALP4_MYCRK|nr:Nitrite extrusion protein [Mycetohabitans rhizoxinica HKI 454]
MALAGLALFFWAKGSGIKSGSTGRAVSSFAITLVGLIALVQRCIPACSDGGGRRRRLSNGMAGRLSIK